MRIQMMILALTLGGCASAEPPAPAPTMLEVSKWTIAAYRVGGDLVSSDTRFSRPSWISFNGEDLDGTPGCGRLLGSYRISGLSITIESGGLLTGSCLAVRNGETVNLFQDSHKVINALNRAASMERRGEQVLLMDVGGVAQVVLTPANGNAPAPANN